MKKMKNAAGALGLVLAIVLALVACPTESSAGGGGETTYYYGSDYLAEYKLAITKDPNRAAFRPAGGNNYKLEITLFKGGEQLTNSGKVAQASGGNCTLSGGGGSFTVAVNSGNDGITAVSGNIPVQGGGTFKSAGKITSGYIQPGSKGMLIGIAMPETESNKGVGNGEELKNAALALGYNVDLQYAGNNQNT
jgi:hypothetical protein